MNPNVVDRRSERLGRLIAVLARLDAPSRSVSDLMLALPALVRDLGFDHAEVHRIQDGAPDPQLAEMIRDLHPILVPGPAAFVAAPIVSGTSAIGVLKADCRDSGRPVDEVDRDVLAAFAAGLRMALASCVLHEQLVGTRSQMAQLSRDLWATPGRIDEIPLAREPVGESRPGRRPAPLPASLTDRELEVLGLMADGCSNTAIAERLEIAESTAKKHAIRVLRKLGVNNRAEAVVWWFRAGHGDGPIA